MAKRFRSVTQKVPSHIPSKHTSDDGVMQKRTSSEHINTQISLSETRWSSRHSDPKAYWVLLLKTHTELCPQWLMELIKSSINHDQQPSTVNQLRFLITFSKQFEVENVRAAQQQCKILVSPWLVWILPKMYVVDILSLVVPTNSSHQTANRIFRKQYYFIQESCSNIVNVVILKNCPTQYMLEQFSKDVIEAHYRFYLQAHSTKMSENSLRSLRRPYHGPIFIKMFNQFLGCDFAFQDTFFKSCSFFFVIVSNKLYQQLYLGETFSLNSSMNTSFPEFQNEG